MAYKRAMLISTLLTGASAHGFGFGFGSTYFGATTISNKKIDSLTAHGSSTVSKSNIKHDATINGAANIDKTNIGGTLEVNGALTADKLEVGLQARVNGYLTARASLFQEGLTVNGKALLEDITTPVLRVKKSVELKNSTITECIIGKKGSIFNSSVETLRGKFKRVSIKNSDIKTIIVENENESNVIITLADSVISSIVTPDEQQVIVRMDKKSKIQEHLSDNIKIKINDSKKTVTCK